MYQIINVNDTDYRSDKTRVNASTLKSIIQHGDYILNYKKEYSGVQLGNAIHLYCEKPLNKKVIMLPIEIGKTYSGKKAQEFIESNSTLLVLDEKDFNKYTCIIEALQHRVDASTYKVKSFLNNSKALKEATIHFEIEGIPAKARIDWLLIDEENKKVTIIDHKSDKAETVSDFEYSYNKKLYWFSMIFYAIPFIQEGYEVEIGFNIFSTAEPYNIYYTQMKFAEDYEDVYKLIVMYAMIWQSASQKKIYNGYGEVGNLKLNYMSKTLIKERVKNLFKDES